MLVKWAIEGRRKRAESAVPAKGVDLHRTAPSKEHPSATARDISDQQQIPQGPGKPETTAQSPLLTAELDRLHFQSSNALAKSSENDNDRAFRRIEAEEMASSLRDDKLMNMSGMPQIHRHNSYQSTGEGTHALTKENIQKFTHDHGADPSHHRKERAVDDSSSVVLEPSRSVQSTLHRPSLKSLHESDRTITPRNP
jgi:hypothetical protein